MIGKMRKGWNDGKMTTHLQEKDGMMEKLKRDVESANVAVNSLPNRSLGRKGIVLEDQKGVKDVQSLELVRGDRVLDITDGISWARPTMYRVKTLNGV
jgi:hypothetical protein